MFRIFKKLKDDREVTANPEILFNSKIAISEIEVHGLKLQDSADIIPIDKVSTTTFERTPTDIVSFPSGTGITWKDNKVYYESSNGPKEYLLANRMQSVLDFGGIIHMKSGAKYVVQDRTIIGIGIHQDIVKPYQKITKEKIERKFGKASMEH